MRGISGDMAGSYHMPHRYTNASVDALWYSTTATTSAAKNAMERNVYMYTLRGPEEYETRLGCERVVEENSVWFRPGE
jgi:hypothetical protein